MQPALRRSPGDFSAVQVWVAQPGTGSEAIRRVARRAAEEASQVLDARVLFALAAPHAGGKTPALLPRESGSRWLPPSRGDLFLQVAADNRESMLSALRRTTAACTGALRLNQEISGGRIGIGREPFGFRDGFTHHSEDERARAMTVTKGSFSGGSWIFYLLMQQDVVKFQALPDAKQAAVVGRTPAGELVPKAGATAHVRRMQEANTGDALPFVRRGFPYRAHGAEGLAFIAASGRPETISRALDGFLGAKGQPDALGDYAWGVSGGVFWAPPAEWFRSHE
jgi:putative iron-dependent peroxidase